MRRKSDCHLLLKRPGLAIQIANRQGLAPKIRAVNELRPRYFRESPGQRVQRAIEMFGEGQLHLRLTQ